jgi:para-nitrobenzyl esterase
VDALRWQPPQEPEPWTAQRATTAFAPACAQYGRIYGPGANNRYDATIGTTLNQAVGSEDCLYLNIWRPRGSEQNLPVIVFFHGGSNVSGYTADPVYDGAALASTANAVVVTANFRLGILGFLNLPQLRTGDPANDSGNYTMLDSIKALQFVQKNARAFGGNPDNVTIMGQSAGAINVWALQTSPMMVAANPKLFHRNVPLSGGISLASNLPAGSLPTLSPASTYLLQGNALLQNLVIADGLATDTASALAYIATQSNAQIAAYMRSKTPAQLFATLLTRLALLGLSGSGPSRTARWWRPTRSTRSPRATTCTCRSWPVTRATKASCSRPSCRWWEAPATRAWSRTRSSSPTTSRTTPTRRRRPRSNSGSLPPTCR